MALKAVIEHGADRSQRVLEFGIPPPADERGPRGRLGQPEQHAHAGRLARTGRGLGLVNQVVPDEQLDSAVQDLLERVTRGSAESKGLGKRAFYAQIDLDQPKAYAYTIEVMAAASQLPDAAEGMHAFLDKRKPKWRRGR